MPHINDLRQHLLDTLGALRDRENPMDVDRARAVATVATVLVESAKVEVEYLRVTGQDAAPFLAAPEGQPNLPPGITGITRHRLQA